MQDPDPTADRAPHALPVAAVLAALSSGPDGLTEAEAAARLARLGPNRLPEPPRRSLLARLAAQFANVLIYVLLAAAAVTIWLDHWVDTAVILAVVLANGLIGFLQEGRAEQAMDGLRRVLAPRAAVLRDGRRRTVPAEVLVPGDVVLVEAGDRVPADLRLIEAHGLFAVEAILTGESVPVPKSSQPVAAASTLGDRRPMLFSGTMVSQGTGRGVVTATGAATEIGRIGGLLASVEELTTPLVVQMDRFGRALSLVILSASGLLFLWGMARGQMPLAELFMAVVGLAVAAIPEGLPAVMTITLAIGVQAMARRNAIVRRLPAIESIGAATVICTDKTGTLTRNEMMVVTAETAAGRFEVGGEGYAPEGEIAPAGDLTSLALAAALCNDAELHGSGGRWTIEGDPMEGALLAFAGKVLADPRSGWRRLDAHPFSAHHRYMAVLASAGADRRIFVKGAPERVLAMCGGAAGAEGFDAAAWHGRAEAIAAQGQRVLALAAAPAAGDRLDEAHLQGRLTFLGLVGLIDPPRPEAVAAVAECRRAGIAVKMITGDHAGTAAAIARAVGLDRPDSVLTGAEIDATPDDDLPALAARSSVFARTSPEHKLRLVMALQARGERVAMTGDGVNDAPALRRADTGIAMGRSGSEAAKEAADLVLADDNFASIAAAVREGRTVQDNLRKVISFVLPTNAGEAVTVGLALLLGLALPLSAVQILWVNLITSITLGFALAFERPEPGVMDRPPRAPRAGLLSPTLVWHVLLVAGLFVGAVAAIQAWAAARGLDAALSRTLVMNLLVVLEIFHLFFIRNFGGTSLRWSLIRGTPVVWASVGAVTLAQFAVTYLGPAQAMLGTVAVPFADGVAVVAAGAVFLVLLEAEKQIRLRLAARRW